MTLIETYLYYLTLTEREWNTDTENPDSFDQTNFRNLFLNKGDPAAFKHMRHSLQPSMYDLYIKNFLGDYMGRPDCMNNVTMRHVGFDQFLKDLEMLKKKVEYAEKIKDKFPDNFFGFTSRVGETNDPGDDADGDMETGDGAGDGLGGEGGDGDGGGE